MLVLHGRAAGRIGIVGAAVRLSGARTPGVATGGSGRATAAGSVIGVFSQRGSGGSTGAGVAVLSWRGLHLHVRAIGACVLAVLVSLRISSVHVHGKMGMLGAVLGVLVVVMRLLAMGVSYHGLFKAIVERIGRSIAEQKQKSFFAAASDELAE